MKKILAVALLLSTCLAQAQSNQAAHVELMVIRYLDSTYEIMRRQAGDDYSSSQQTLAAAALDLSRGGNEQIFAIKENLRLANEADSLQDSNDYDVLYHGAWQQPLMSPGQAQLIRFLSEPQNGLLAGNAQISFNNNFLLQLSLLYDLNFHINYMEQAVPQIQTVTIKLEEVIENKKVYYFDHPAVGVVVTVQTIDLP